MPSYQSLVLFGLLPREGRVVGDRMFFDRTQIREKALHVFHPAFLVKFSETVLKLLKPARVLAADGHEGHAHETVPLHELKMKHLAS